MLSLVAKLLARRPGATAPANRPRNSSFRPAVEALEGRDCPAALAAPGIVLLDPAGPTQVNLTWDDVADETGYRVYRWNGTEAVQVATVGANETSATVTGLQPGQAQWFRVEAYNDVDTPGLSPWQAVTLPTEPITAPTGLSATSVGPRQLTLTWGDATGETGYRVYLWDGSQPKLIGTLAADTTSFAVSGLAPDVTYHFYVEAFNASNVAMTDWKAVRTLREPITAPANLTAVAASGTQINLKWGSATGETGYRVYRWDGSKSVLIATLGANATGFAVKNLKPGTTYWFHVQAFNRSNFAITAWKSATTPAPAKLKAPTGLTARRYSSTAVDLKWNATSRAAGYRVYQWTGTSWRLVRTLSASTTRTVVGGLAARKSYFFLIQAFTLNNAEAAGSAVGYYHY